MSARSCREVRADLSAYLDGDLDVGLTGETRVHLERCASCRSELELLRLTLGALRGLPDLPPPAAILAGVRARLWPEPWYRRLLDGRQWLLGLPVGALATLLVVVGISLFQARYPDLSRTPAPGPVPQPAAPGGQAEPPSNAAPAPATPAAPTLVADRLAVPRPVPADRGDLRAKGAFDSAPQPRAASSMRKDDVSGASAGADESESYRAAPAVPTEPHPPAAPAVIEVKVEESSFSRPEPPAAPPEDARREQAPRVEYLAAAPSRGVSLEQQPAPERTAAVGDYPAEGHAGVGARQDRDAASLNEYDGKAGTSSPRRASKKKAMALVARDADRGSGLGNAELAEEKLTASTGVRIVCLLPPEGDTVDDLTRLIRPEGDGVVDVSVLEPRAVRAAFAPHRGRPGFQPEPAQGWTVTAALSQGSLTRLLDALASRTGLRILEQPAAPAAEDPAALLELHLTVLR